MMSNNMVTGDMNIKVQVFSGGEQKSNGEDLPAISVIIPVYNAVKTLQQAVESVLTQSFQDFEIILIDDCSTDGSYDLIKDLWENNTRIRIVQNIKNLGPDPTRNYGMRISKGKYITFMDDDDFYLPDLLSNFYKIAEEHQAEVVSSMGFYHTKSAEIPRDLPVDVFPELDSDYCNEIVVAPSDIKERLEGFLLGQYSIACWNKLYLRDFLIYNNIRFRPASDDRGFVFACLIHAEKYIKIPYIGNLFRNAPNSLSRKNNAKDMEKLEEVIYNLDGFAQEFVDIMGEHPFFREHPEYAEMTLIHQLAFLDRLTVLPYFPDPTAVSSDVLKTTKKTIEKIFGKHAPSVEFLFMRYQALLREKIEQSQENG